MQTVDNSFEFVIGVSIPKQLFKPSDSDQSGPSNFCTVRVRVYKLADEIFNLLL